MKTTPFFLLCCFLITVHGQQQQIPQTSFTLDYYSLVSGNWTYQYKITNGKHLNLDNPSTIVASPMQTDMCDIGVEYVISDGTDIAIGGYCPPGRSERGYPISGCLDAKYIASTWQYKTGSYRIGVTMTFSDPCVQKRIVRNAGSGAIPPPGETSSAFEAFNITLTFSGTATTSSLRLTTASIPTSIPVSSTSGSTTSGSSTSGSSTSGSSTSGPTPIPGSTSAKGSSTSGSSTAGRPTTSGSASTNGNSISTSTSKITPSTSTSANNSLATGSAPADSSKENNVGNTTPKKKSSMGTIIIVVVIVGVALIFAIVVIAIILVRRKKNSQKDADASSLSSVEMESKPANKPATPSEVRAQYSRVAFPSATAAPSAAPSTATTTKQPPVAPKPKATSPKTAEPATNKAKDTQNLENFGDLILNYNELEMQSQIGAGAFGEVWKGKYRGLKVAVKKLKSNPSGNQDLVGDFEGEARVHKDLKPHPNVVLFMGITMDPLCMVLEYCKEGSLLTFLKNNDLSVHQKVKICKDIARGMGHLHYGKPGLQVIHRDLAARNVLMKKGGICAISDFGMARFKEEADNASQTVTDMGPIKWMAPESIERREYSIKSDVWSFGVTLYEIVTQKTPWPGKNNGQVAVTVAKGGVMDIPEDCPPLFASLMKMCWKYEPAERPTFVTILSILSGVKKEATMTPKFVEVPEENYIKIAKEALEDDHPTYNSLTPEHPTYNRLSYK